MVPGFWAIPFAIALAAALPAIADEAPKYGGTLTYMIPADSPPSFDAHREETYATIHSAAPFYSVLIRINPENPGSTTDIVCDLCTELPQPTDGGKTYTFKIRDDVKFHNGDKLTAEDVAASLNKIAFPPEGTLSPRSTDFMMVKDITAPDEHNVVIHLKFATSAFLPALADPYNWIYQKKVLDKDIHWYEHNIMGSGPFVFEEFQTGHCGVRATYHSWGATAARGGRDRHDWSSAETGRAVHRAADRAGAHLCRPGGHRDRERAAARRDPPAPGRIARYL